MAAITALASAFLLSTGLAVPFKLLAIGDSLTDEYGEFPSTVFSGPDNKNWVELLEQYRPDNFSMGGEASTYVDYRKSGFEYNYGVVGFKAEGWEELLYRQYTFSEFLDPENSLDINTRFELKADLGAVNAVLIFIGGNDLSLANDDVKNDEIRFYIGRIHDYVRANAPANLPIIVATVPDIGATPKEKILDPTLAAAARARVATLNANIIADLGIRANTYIARIDHITDRIFDQVPFQINGTEFINSFRSDNPPLYLFCRQQFHPSTAPQALIANEILAAINTFAATPIAPFSNREILSFLPGINPDQPLIDYIAATPDDGDALPDLLEYLLGKDPAIPESPFTFGENGSATYTPNSAALDYATLTAMESDKLDGTWDPVPLNRLTPAPGGAITILPDPTEPKLFYTLQGQPKP
ncbi:MAG: SGNH/GDSL hydrolase family protein [Akkermansiaceae bacterium]|nr:SGNH/GDSL hydrolase family protein [Akkermansiaceae bacterium]